MSIQENSRYVKWVAPDNTESIGIGATMTASSPGEYVVYTALSEQDFEQCKSEKSFTVVENELPTKTEERIIGDLKVCEGTPRANLELDNPTPGMEYKWSTNVTPNGNDAIYNWSGEGANGGDNITVSVQIVIVSITTTTTHRANVHPYNFRILKLEYIQTSKFPFAKL